MAVGSVVEGKYEAGLTCIRPMGYSSNGSSVNAGWFSVIGHRHHVICRY